MRVFRLTDSHEARIAAEGPAAIVAEIWHVRRSGAGGSVDTPLGHVAAAPRAAETEAAAHWRADLLLRSDDVATDLVDPGLPAAVADWLLRETAATEPLLVQVYRGHNSDYVLRGQIWDDD